MDNVSVEENNEITVCKVDNTLAYDNRGFEMEMESSTTSTLIGGERPANQLLDSFMESEDTPHFEFEHQNILPVKLSIEATLCEQAELSKQAEISKQTELGKQEEISKQTESSRRADSSEISDEELVEYPKGAENLVKPIPPSTSAQAIKLSQTSEDLMCTSPASQTDSNLQVTSSTSAQTIPTSQSEYVTCKSGAASNQTSAASYLTAHDSTYHSKTLSASNSDSTLSSDSGTLIHDDERDTEDESAQNYDELLDITPTKKLDYQQLQSDRITDLKDEEEDDDSSSTGDPLYRTIISNVIKEPYDTEIPKSVICDSSLSESFVKHHTVEQPAAEFPTLQSSLEPSSTAQAASSTKLTPRVSLSEQSDSWQSSTSLETAIYRGDQNQSDFSSLESNTEIKTADAGNIRNEQMPSIMASGNLDQWDESALDDEMIVHEDAEHAATSKKSSADLLYTLEEEEESKTDDGCLSGKQIKDHTRQHHSSADNSSSLMEFERLEKEVDQSKLPPHHSSLDSIGSIGSAGVLGTPKLLANAPGSDNASVSSLNEFERLEKECEEQQQQHEQIKKQLTEIEEGHESQASDSAETISGCSQVRLPKDEDDTSEIELELNAKLDDYTSCPTASQMPEDLEATPVHIAQPSQPKSDEGYSEEILKIVTTTENRIIEEMQDVGE